MDMIKLIIDESSLACLARPQVFRGSLGYNRPFDMLIPPFNKNFLNNNRLRLIKI